MDANNLQSTRQLVQEMIPNPRILVVDDEPSSAKLVQKHLKDAGYDHIITTYKPTDALDTISDIRPDVLLLDMIMPEMSGLDVLHAVRSRDPVLPFSVIVLTASAERDIKRRALELEITDFLQKPIDPIELALRVRNAIALQSLRRYCDRLLTGETNGNPESVGAANDDGTPVAPTDRASPPRSPAELLPSKLSWPVLQRTQFEELKALAKVMVVDDEPINIKVVRKYLVSEGYKNVIATSDATVAVQLMHRERPDLVLLDIMMPDVNGLDILKKVRATKQLMDIPVIILTASTDRAQKQKALELGATEFLTKPVDPTDAMPRVRNALVVKAHQNHITEYARELECEVSRYMEKVKGYTSALEKANGVLQQSRSAAQAANRAKSQFLANMSHEIRTPLTAMIGFAEETLDEPDSKTMSGQDVANLETIVRNGNHLLNVINDILDLSKIEAGRLEVEVVACSPARITAEVVQSMQAQAGNKGVTLHAECATPIPEFIRTDPTCLRRILLNLIGNAVKFTEQGSIRVVMSLLDTKDSDPGLQWECIDTGIGIRQEHLDKLFQPFVQADGSVQRSFGGTGLGLTISRQLIEKLGGRISVHSELGSGSTFCVVLPAGPLDDVRLVKRPFTSAARDASGETQGDDMHVRPEKLNCRVLLAEDSIDSQRLISLILRKSGAQVIAVDDGWEAVRHAHESQESATPFDIILMDMQMPVLDGYAAVRRLREGGYPNPIIALTANAMFGEREKCLTAGCDDYLAKPVHRDRLLATVAHYANQRIVEEPSRDCLVPRTT